MLVLGAIAGYITWVAYRAKSRGKCLRLYLGYKSVNLIGVSGWWAGYHTC
jgi:hypothetical protein